MSPEQFRGDPADARSDQFSFCVALYEALYGVRPFRGENLLSLTMSVTEGELRPADDAAKHDVPVWIRRAITRGLRPDPADRFPSMQALIDRLEDDPAVRRRRRLGAGAVVAVVVATMLVAWQTTSRRRAAAEREIARHLDEATRAAAEARKAASEARTLRQDAFAAFDRPDRRNGELLWRQVRARLPRADASYDRAERSLETAFTLDSSREQHRSGLADLRLEHLLFAEDFRLGSKAILLEERLAAVDPDGGRRKALAAPGTLELHTRPPASRIVLERYERDPVTGRRSARPVGPLDASRATTSLAPGSYRLLLDGPGLAHVIYPFEIRRGDRTVADLVLPPASAVPKGFVVRARGDVLVRRRGRTASNAVPRRRSDPPTPNRRLPHRAPRDDVPGLDRLPERSCPTGKDPSRAGRFRHRARCARPAGAGRRLAHRDTTGLAPLRSESARADQLRRPQSAVAPGLAALSDRWGVARRRDAVPRMVAGKRPPARRPSVLRARVGARRARRGRSAVSPWRRAHRGRREHRHHLRADRWRLRTRTRSARIPVRAARSGWTIWPATSWRSSPQTRSPAGWRYAAAATTSRRPRPASAIAFRFPRSFRDVAVGLRVCADAAVK